MDPTLQPAHVQAALIAAGQMSSRELLALIEARHRRLHGVVNAVVVERFDEARAVAAAADEAVARGNELGPLHGVPVTVKEVIDWVGTPSTWGDPRHADNRPRRNAVVVERLVESGAVVWGKTNVPLDLGEWQTFNDLYGRTNNPHDPDRTPGGSSGGSAAAIATGIAGLEIGSDIGGSIRFPAHYCGVFGHKPSFGLVPTTGHNYPGHDADADINVLGPLARSATDLRLAMRLLSDFKLVPDTSRALADFTVGVMLDNPCGGPQDAEMTRLLESAIDEMRSAGLVISDASNPVDYRLAQENYLLLNFAATAFVDRGGRSYLGRARTQLTHEMWLQLANERQRIRNRWADYFASVDLLLCPVAASAAPPHQTDVAFAEQTIPINGQPESIQGQWIWAGMASGAYLPATVVPVGRTSAGLPVGIQIIAPFGHDLRSIRFAELIEQRLGGYVPPALAVEGVK